MASFTAGFWPRPAKAYDLVAGGTAGGGGYGDPLERDPQLVMQDLENGVISHRAAKEIYRVAYDPASLMIDQEKTTRFREEERANRKKRGVPFETFEKEWLTLKPDQEIMEFYGDWPSTSYSEFTYFGKWHD